MESVPDRSWGRAALCQSNTRCATLDDVALHRLDPQSKIEMSEDTAPANQQQRGRYSLNKLLCAVSSCGVAFGLLTWAPICPPLAPIGISIPILWIGLSCLGVDSVIADDYHVLGFIGCCLSGLAVLICIPGGILVWLMWIVPQAPVG